MNQRKSALTFGNILLTLLVLGTLAVMGLMIFAYQKLTEPASINSSAQHTPTAPQQPTVQQLPPKNKAEQMSPEGGNANPNQQNVHIPNKPRLLTQEEKDLEMGKIATSEDSLEDNMDKLDKSTFAENVIAPKPKKPKPKKPKPEESNTALNAETFPSNKNNNFSNSNDERPLPAINKKTTTYTAGERPLPPKNAYRSPAPQPIANDEKPLSPKKATHTNNAIDNLF